jgi:integrase
VGHDARHIDQKESHLKRLQGTTEASRLADLTADALERHLFGLRTAKLASQTVNHARKYAVAFMNWCVKTGRIESNPLAVVPKLDASRDRRRIRRPLTTEELERLLDVADDCGRKPWYLAASLAGLRRGDLERLTWADVDFEAGTVTVRGGKARRVDLVPMHPQLAAELERLRSDALSLPTAKVFPEAVTNLTRAKDFLRAGLAHREVVIGADGKPVMIGRGKKKRPKTRIVTEDAEGRVVDLHALRTTLGTQLARAGVAPQIAQRIMRHGDYRTTLKHYTVLGLADTAAAIERLPTVGEAREAALATGTVDNRPDSARQHNRQHTEGDSARRQPTECDKPLQRPFRGIERKSLPHTDESDATRRETAGSEQRATGLEPATFNLEG